MPAVSQRALKTVTNSAPLTPGKQVNQLKAELQKKETENDELKNTIADLTKALDGIKLVKEKTGEANPFLSKTSNADANNKKKKTFGEKAPMPAITAYKYFCEDYKKVHGEEGKSDINMRELWKECQGDTRKKFVDMAAEDKKRFDAENEIYQKKVAEWEVEEKALEMYYEKKQQDLAMEFYEAHAKAQEIVNSKNTKKTKDPDAPKHPKSNYLFFCQEKREEITKKNAGKSPTEITSVLAEEWNKLQKGKGGKKGTKKYDDLAAKDRARYEQEKVAYDAIKAGEKEKSEQERQLQLQKDKEEALQLMREKESEKEAAAAAEKMEVEQTTQASDDNKKKQKKVKDPNAPKGAMSGYMFFCQEMRGEIAKKNPEKSPRDITKLLGEEWSKLEKGAKGKKGTKKYDDLAAKDKLRYETEKKAYDALKPATVDAN